MVESGARGSWSQFVQMVGMRGIVRSPSGKLIELPIKSSLKEGYNTLEYFISSHGSRKGSSDTALRTAKAGYLTRRMVDICQDLLVREEDCGESKGLLLTKEDNEEMVETWQNRLFGRTSAQTLKDPKTKKIIIKPNEIITREKAKIINKINPDEFSIHSVLTCKNHRGTCAKCYGYDLAYNKPVSIGATVGIIAAQSIGEPGTQLTMRTFHTGGVAGQDDITQGLPRVEEIFEARPPKRKAFVSDVDGVVKIEMMEKQIEDVKGKVVTQNINSKVIKIIYKGTDSDKYYFAETARDIMTSEAGKDKKDRIPKKNLKAEITVKDDEEIKRGQTLFKMGNIEIKAKRAGTIKTNDKYIKISFTS